MSIHRKLTILGATGSIGDNTLQVVRGNKSRLQVVGIAGKKNFEKLAKIAEEFGVKHVGIYDPQALEKAKSSGLFDKSVKFYCGPEGLEEIACLQEADTTVSAIVGTQALKPTISAIESGKDIALANKELLVMAGKFVMGAAARKGVKILPLDSEHNAIFQCLWGENKKDISKLIITASGGMFRDFTYEQMKSIKPADALRHPNWKMGPKVTIDSSTLANKGLEVIEAKWLFNVAPDQIQVVVQRQSLVHSMVQFSDGSVKAHLSPPSMTFAISHSLLCPDRGNYVCEPIDFTKPITLDFSPPDTEKFPALKYAYEALRKGGTATAVFNAANEVAVESFLNEKISWLETPQIICQSLESTPTREPETLDDVLIDDAEARENARSAVNRLLSK